MKTQIIVRHPVAVAFRDWLADTFIPDESFYSTLVRVSNPYNPWRGGKLLQVLHNSKKFIS